MKQESMAKPIDDVPLLTGDVFVSANPCELVCECLVTQVEAWL